MIFQQIQGGPQISDSYHLLASLNLLATNAFSQNMITLSIIGAARCSRPKGDRQPRAARRAREERPQSLPHAGWCGRGDRRNPVISTRFAVGCLFGDPFEDCPQANAHERAYYHGCCKATSKDPPTSMIGVKPGKVFRSTKFPQLLLRKGRKWR